MAVDSGRGGARGDGNDLELVRPMLGFPESRRFTIRGLGADYAPYAVLASLDEPGLEFVIVPPGLVFDDYVIEIPDDDVHALELADANDAGVLALVTRRGQQVPTVNLLGPLVVNQRTRRALQVVLQDGRFGATVPVDAGSSRPDRVN